MQCRERAHVVLARLDALKVWSAVTTGTPPKMPTSAKSAAKPVLVKNLRNPNILVPNRSATTSILSHSASTAFGISPENPRFVIAAFVPLFFEPYEFFSYYCADIRDHGARTFLLTSELGSTRLTEFMKRNTVLRGFDFRVCDYNVYEILEGDEDLALVLDLHQDTCRKMTIPDALKILGTALRGAQKEAI